MRERPPLFRHISLAAAWVIVLLITTSAATAQPCPPLQVRNPAGNYIVPGAKGDIPYSGDLALDAYVQQGSARRPSVVVIHGGGWSSGSRVAHIGQILEAVTRAGYNWFALDYRLGGLGADSTLRSPMCAPPCASSAVTRRSSVSIPTSSCSSARTRAPISPHGSQPSARQASSARFSSADSTTVAPLPDAVRALDRAVAQTASPVAPASRSNPPFLVVHGEADTEVPSEQARRYCAGVDGKWVTLPVRRSRGREPSQRELVPEPVELQARDRRPGCRNARQSRTRRNASTAHGCRVEGHSL